MKKSYEKGNMLLKLILKIAIWTFLIIFFLNIIRWGIVLIYNAICEFYI